MPKPPSNLTDKQQAYLAYIASYIAVHRQAPAEHEMQAHFRVTPPSVHRMVLALEEKGAIRRQPGQARSIEVVTDARRAAGQSVETVVPEDFYDKTPGSFVGRWRIVETEVWDRDALDLVVPAQITFDDRGQGDFQMVAMEGGIDCRFLAKRVEFSWQGEDDGHPRCGRGWAELMGQERLEGRIYFHQGDESAFSAIREDAPRRAMPQRGRFRSRRERGW